MSSNPATGSSPGALGRIVVGVDGSPSSEEALRWAVRQGRLTGRPVRAVTSWDYPLDYGVGAVELLDWEANARDVLHATVVNVLGPDGAAQVTEQVTKGHPAQVLLDAVGPADLLVVGSRGHGGFAGMLIGSVSQHVVAHATCPVVVVREQAA